MMLKMCPGNGKKVVQTCTDLDRFHHLHDKFRHIIFFHLKVVFGKDVLRNQQFIAENG